MEKVFPSGVSSYLETFYEISIFVHEALSNPDDENLATTTMTQKGTGGIYELVEDLTDQFENANSNNIDESDFFETLFDFLNDKIYSK